MGSKKDFESPNDIYTPLDEIASELKKRREDEVLKNKVSNFFGVMPKFLQDENTQYAFLSRPVTTPNAEVRYFIDTLPVIQLEPLFLEYPGKFVSRNRDKRFLAKMPLLSGFGKKYGAKVTHKRIVDFHKWEGKELRDVETLWGENLKGYHKKLFLSEYPHLEQNLIDFTEWFNEARTQNGHYYLTFLALFIRNGVLFENFLSGDSDEKKFFEEKVLPSFKKAVEIFGVKPLIFPLLPIKDEKSLVWFSYGIGKKDVELKKPDKITTESHAVQFSTKS